MSSKDIAKILFIPQKTVEEDLEKMRLKAGVNNPNDFRHFCKKLNFHRYLPKRFIMHKRIVFNGSYDDKEIFEF